MGGCQRAGGGGEPAGRTPLPPPRPARLAPLFRGQVTRVPAGFGSAGRFLKRSLPLQKKPPPPPPTALPKAAQAAHTAPGGPPRASVNVFSRKAGNEVQPGTRRLWPILSHRYSGPVAVVCVFVTWQSRCRFGEVKPRGCRYPGL